MGYTKLQICEAAFDEIGIAPSMFDLQPDMLQRAMQRLDAMLAEWNARGVRLGYPIPSTPEGGDLDTEAGIPDSAWQAAVANLAMRIAPSFGKTPMRETKVAAKTSFDTLLTLAALPARAGRRSMPLGAGNKPWRWGDEYSTVPDPLEVGPDSDLEFNG